VNHIFQPREECHYVIEYQSLSHTTLLFRSLKRAGRDFYDLANQRESEVTTIRSNYDLSDLSEFIETPNLEIVY
jgi:hypothetical protein